MLSENSDANVNEEAQSLSDSFERFDEILQIHCELERLIVSDEAVIAEWVQLDIVSVRTYRRRKAHVPEICFTHIEVEESIPSGTIEKVEEILAESLFRVWLSEKRMVAK